VADLGRHERVETLTSVGARCLACTCRVASLGRVAIRTGHLADSRSVALRAGRLSREHDALQCDPRA
jgi:hypothetical protein